MSSVQNIDDYISNFPANVKTILEHIRKLIKTTAPEATESIKYGIPTFELNGNLVHFAAFKNHIGFYPTPSGINAFKNELREYKSAKGSIQFPLKGELPYDLIKRIVEYRVKENASRSNLG